MAGDATQNANVVLTADTKNYQQGMAASEAATNRVLSTVVSLGTAINNLSRSAGKSLEIVSATTIGSLALATKMAGDFQARMSQLNAQSVMTGRSFETTTKQVNDLRSSIGVTTDSIIGLVSQLNSLGQGGQDVRALSESFLRLSSVTGEAVGGLTDGLIQLQRTMGTIGAENTNKYASALANVAANAGVSATGVLQFANAIAPIGKVAGMTQNEIMGVSAAFQKSGADGYGAATAFNKMLTDITRSIQYGSPELGAYANLVGVTVEQFKAMPKTDAVTQIFEAINNQGPDAIKTLERFGLDGIRTYKSLQAVAQSGGIGKSVKEATEGYQDTDKFMKASEQAMNGLNESGQQLRNTLSQIGEAFGSAFIGPLTTVTNLLNTVLTPIAALLSALGSIPGVAALAGAGIVGFAGLALKHVGLIGGGALVRQVLGGMTGAGFQMGRNAENAPRWAQNAAADVESGNTSWIRRQAFNAGNFVGGMGQGPRPGDLPGAEQGRGFFSRANSFAGNAIRGAGSFMASQYEPLWPSRINNPNLRDMGSPGSVMSRFSPQNVGAEAQLARTSLRDLGRAATSGAGALSGMGSAAGQFVSSVTRAGIGGAGLLGNLAVRGAGAAMGGLGGLMSMQNMGPMATIGGGMAIASWLGDVNSKQQQGVTAINNAGDINAAGGAYRTALGEAARATMTFADVVNRAASDAGGAEFAGQVRPSDVASYQQHKATAQYTDPALAGMTDAQLEVYSKSAAGMSPKAQQLFMFDLMKKFSGDTTQVQRYLDMTKTGQGPIDLMQMYAGTGQTGFLGGLTDESIAAGGYAAATRNTVNATLQSRGGVKEQSKYGVANLNALVAGSQGKYSQSVASLQQLAGAGTQDEKDAIENLLNAGSFGDTIRGRSTDSPQLVYQRLKERMASGQATPAEKTLFGLYSQSGLTGDAMFSTKYQVPAPNPAQLFANTDTVALQRVRQTTLGGLVMNNGSLGQQINTATNNQGDVNATQIAMKALAESAIRTQGGFSNAIGELDRFKNAVGDASDPLSQLGDAAQKYARQLQGEQMHYMTQQGRFQELQKNYAQSQRTLAANPTAPDAMANVLQDRQALEAARAANYDRVANIAIGYRQLLIQRQYGAEDIATSQGRAREQKGIQEGYAQEDFTLSRQRAMEDFNLQRSRAEEEFHLQRTRNEAAYQRQQARTLRDFNRGRRIATEDYNRSRLRAEEDFNHQVEVMTRQAAKNLYNIYERVNVQSTWSAQNLLSNVKDQNERLAEQQANLAKLRQMGLSGDAISMLGLNDPANAQQLARFVDDAVNDPKVIDGFNKAITERTNAAVKVVTDQDNEQWKEMQYQFGKSMKRGAQDFNRTMNQQREQFNISLSDQRTERKIQLAEQAADFYRQMAHSRQDFNTQSARQQDDFNKQLRRNNANFALSMKYQNEDYARQIKRANEAFNEAATDQSIYIQKYAVKAASALTGAAKTQFAYLMATLDKAQTEAAAKLTAMAISVAAKVAQIGAMYNTLGAQSTAAADHNQTAGGGTGSSGIIRGGSITNPYNPPKHYGVDIGSPVGNPVYAYKPGRVADQFYQAGGFGNHVRLDHGGGLYTIYGHMSSYSVGKGQAVGGGQKLGGSGNTGHSTGPHLHYEVRKGNLYSLNAAVNPMPYFRFKSTGGGVDGQGQGDSEPHMLEPGEYVMPKHRVKEMGQGFFDMLRNSGVAGIRNALAASSGRVSEASTVNYYQRIDKGTTFTGDITVMANDPRKFAREMEEQQRMKALVGRGNR